MLLIINYVYLCIDISFWLDRRLPSLMNPKADRCFHVCLGSLEKKLSFKFKLLPSAYDDIFYHAHPLAAKEDQ